MSTAGTSLRRALAAVSERLQQAGIERARAEARLLAAHSLGVSVEAIVRDDDFILVPAQLIELEVLAMRRARHQPMAQILGRREFFGRDFRVSAAVLTPRPDSETLIEAVLAQIADRTAPLKILELGVGSGCLLLTLLAELRNAEGTGVDISSGALGVARQNAGVLGVLGRCSLLDGDWTAAVDGRFDIVISNPPYIPSADISALDPEVSQYEPRLALDGGEDGLTFYRRLAGDLERLLTSAGLVAVEIGQGQGNDVAGLVRAAGLTIIDRRQDLAGIERCVVARKA